MSLGTFTPGVYTGTYNSNAIGLVEIDAFSLRYRPAAKKINSTNSYGQTLIDGIYQGMTGVQLLCTFKEWNTAVKQALWPYGSASPSSFDGTLGQIGLLLSDMAKVIVLTAQANSPAAANGPATFTANLACLAPENDVSILMGPDERNIPVLFDLLLYDDSGTKRFFKLT